MSVQGLTNPFSDIVHKHFAEGSLIPLNGLEFVIKDNVNGEIHLVCRGMTRSMQKKMKARVDERIKQQEFKFVPEVTQQKPEKKSLLGKFFQRKTGE
jgi:excinuclease UvrABC helicase subunit UvrB